MKFMSKEELTLVSGGFDLTGTMFNAMIKGINSLLDLGRSLGTAIRRISSNNICRF